MTRTESTGPTRLEEEWLLQAQGLSKQFCEFMALEDVDLRVRKGSIHALIGPNGAGKSTCFHLLTKFIEPTAGTIRFKGVDITRESSPEIARRGIGRSFQISASFGGLTVLENVRVALQRRLGTHYRFWSPAKTLNRLNDRAEALIRDVGITVPMDTVVNDLPYGTKRALEIATTLALDPELLLLDEPTQGMAHDDVDRVMALIRQVAVSRTVLMVEHNMKVVSGICDTITVLSRGRVLAEGTYEEVSADPRVVEAYMGRKRERSVR